MKRETPKPAQKASKTGKKERVHRGGMPKGHVTKKTLEKEAAKALIRELVMERLRPLVNAQMDNAQGISHFMLRDKSGRFERVTDVDQIQAALNADDAEEGSSYYIYTKDPNVQAFTDLLNRTIGKPVDDVQIEHTGGLTISWKEHEA